MLQAVTKKDAFSEALNPEDKFVVVEGLQYLHKIMLECLAVLDRPYECSQFQNCDLCLHVLLVSVGVFLLMQNQL